MDDSEDRMLRALDPGSQDPGYWPRFHRNIVERAQLQLARRRAEVRVTVSRLLYGWSRTLVPTALAAAAIAALLLMDSGRPMTVPSGEPLVDIVASGANFDPFALLDLPTQQAPEAAVPQLTLVALEEGY